MSFGGSDDIAMAALQDADKPGPLWKDLRTQVSRLSQKDQGDLNRLTIAFEGDGVKKVGEGEMMKQLEQFPPKLYPFISQSSSAWLALRKHHAITASVAFDLLLCGTGLPRERYGRAGTPIRMSSYRRSAHLPPCVQQCAPNSLEFKIGSDISPIFSMNPLSFHSSFSCGLSLGVCMLL
jgi:hypothetical protein